MYNWLAIVAALLVVRRGKQNFTNLLLGTLVLFAFESYPPFKAIINSHTTLNQPYVILNVTPSAGMADVQRAKRRKMAQYHPDRNREEGAELQLARVHWAADVLKNSSRKDTYDRLGDVVDLTEIKTLTHSETLLYFAAGHLQSIPGVATSVLIGAVFSKVLGARFRDYLKRGVTIATLAYMLSAVIRFTPDYANRNSELAATLTGKSPSILARLLLFSPWDYIPVLRCLAPFEWASLGIAFMSEMATFMHVLGDEWILLIERYDMRNYETDEDRAAFDIKRYGVHNATLISQIIVPMHQQYARILEHFSHATHVKRRRVKPIPTGVPKFLKSVPEEVLSGLPHTRDWFDVPLRGFLPDGSKLLEELWTEDVVFDANDMESVIDPARQRQTRMSWKARTGIQMFFWSAIRSLRG